MTLKELQHFFHDELDAISGKDEVNSFFRMLTKYHLDFNPVEIALNSEQGVSDRNLNLFNKAINRLKKEEPIQYIIGETEFCGLPFKVNPNVLIPRPETEELVDWILNEEPKAKSQGPRTILDIGTGSGCIAIALAKQLPSVKVYALDVSKEALEIAKGNAELNRVEINFIEADILNLQIWDLGFGNLEFDLIVSNPPYVRKQEKSIINNNVLKYEPHLALFVENEDPLLFYKAICEFSVHKLKAGGSLFLEINQYLEKETRELLESFNFNSIVLKKDFFGNERMLKLVKP